MILQIVYHTKFPVSYITVLPVSDNNNIYSLSTPYSQMEQRRMVHLL